MIKSHRKLSLEENFLNFYKEYLKKPGRYVIFNGKGLNAFSLRLGTREGHLLLFLASAGGKKRKQKTHRSEKSGLICR